MLLAHPAIEEQQKVEALVAGTGQLPTGGMRTETFLRLVLRKGREKVLRQISQAFLDEWDKDRGVVRAHVSSARQPTDEQLGQLRQTLSHLTGAAVELDSSTEPELIGGMTVRVGDRLVDGSLRGRLERLHRNIHRS
jgi:F-type H+-transporting ATPase subunit delta